MSERMSFSEQPTYQVLEAQPAPVARPAVLELFRLGILSGLIFFVATLLITLAAGEELKDAFRSALRIGGISLGIIWPLLIFFYLSDDLGRTLNAFLAYRLRLREMDALQKVRLAEIHMQQTISLARVELEQDRREVARQALIIGSANLLPSGHTPYDPVEKALTEAVKLAYDLADREGYLPNTGPAPFSKRALGEGLYAEVRRRLLVPGEKFGVLGSQPVATYDAERKQWRLNLRAYPTYSDALMALTGRRPVGCGGGATPPPRDAGNEP